MVLLDRIGEKRRNRAELVTHYTIKYARLVMEPGLSSSARPREIPLRPGGITIQDIAQLAEREVYGMTIFSKTTGLMRNSNGVVPYESEPTMMQGTIYIDGKLVDPEDAVKNAGKYGPDLQARMEDEGW